MSLSNFPSRKAKNKNRKKKHDQITSQMKPNIQQQNIKDGKKNEKDMKKNEIQLNRIHLTWVTCFLLPLIFLDRKSQEYKNKKFFVPSKWPNERTNDQPTNKCLQSEWIVDALHCSQIWLGRKWEKKKKIFI